MGARKHAEVSTDDIGLLTLGRSSQSEEPTGNGSTLSRGSGETERREDPEGQAQDRDERMSNQQVTQLARTFSVQSKHQTVEGLNSNDSRLDPFSPDFDAKRWARAFYQTRHDGEGGTLRRVAGFAARHLEVGGYGVGIDYQMSVGNAPLKLLSTLTNSIRKHVTTAQRVSILRDVDALVLPGEQLCVLGPPGSGCSTFLKSIAGDTYGLEVAPTSYINYHGITARQMSHEFRGEATYTAEVDHHLPELTVGDTLYFAALARAPRIIPGGMSRVDYARHQRDVIMAMFGISHTMNTKVGNDFVRGVSGGERKRVTIAEAALSYAPLQCWDNSTRGLDSANAVEFCKTLRTQSDVFGITSCVAIYQAPQAAYDLFDKVTVFYEGRQIYFGRASDAKAYFERLGFQCPESQTTPDFLTSMTSPSERIARPGMEEAVPRSPDEFADLWKNSKEYKKLLDEIEQFATEHPYNSNDLQDFSRSMKDDKSRLQRKKSPYTISYWEQVRLCLWRGMVLTKSSISVPISMLIINSIQILLVSSLYYNLPADTSSFFLRGSFIFIMVLLNTFTCMLEIMTLYAKRDTVEKHNRYAFYHPSAEALAAMVIDLPYKISLSICMNIVGYFMANLRREPGAFFFYLLISFSCMMCLSMVFRLLGSMTKTVAQAMVPASLVILAITLYTGFAIPISHMRGWASWIRWINPVAYAFEALITNEFHDREFACALSAFVPAGPGYENTPRSLQTCNAKGSLPGSTTVSGTAFYETSYSYNYAHRWRNWAIIIAFTVLFAAVHLGLSDLIAAQRSKGEVLVLPRDKAKKKGRSRKGDLEHMATGDERIGHSEETGHSAHVQKQTSVFHWENVCYDITIKGEPRRILDNVDGWIKPGTLTALMGVSGAGKTTLLDVLADRVSTGVITGDMLVDGRQRDESFQRKTGYVQQQDLHLHTSTVREALQFSALLRQPRNHTRQEKLDYVEQVLSLLEMHDYADAVVGIPGEGLNVEQRKRLTIGVELVARPKLLIFLDEPTSGLDSQTSWSICNLMEKLTNSGQAILCTIHQPSAMLFQRFDRLLLLGKGGKTMYFGDIGKNSATLLDYFARNGGHPCPPEANPAEYMLEVIGAAPGTHTKVDWHSAWRNSPEYEEVQRELGRLRHSPNRESAMLDSQDKSNYQEFAAPMSTQFLVVCHRVFQQYWRSPGYIYAKAELVIVSALFIGFSFFMGENTQQGLQNQMFGVFIVLIVLMQLIFQTLPSFVTQRTLYEARERQSKTYAWQAFVLSNMFVELVWAMFLSVFTFLCWYYPLGCYRNAELTGAVHSRSTLIFLLIWVTFIWASTFGNMLISGLDTVDLASSMSTFLVFLCYSFCGLLVSPTAMPGFWIWMYRVNPFTYLATGFLSTSLGRAPMHCDNNEYQIIRIPPNQTCGVYMRDYLDSNGGSISDPNATSQCQYCQYTQTDQFLATFGAHFSERWMDFGLLLVYAAFNAFMAVFLYWALRVPKRKKRKTA
ncbi:Multidrug resistance protein [Aspergillus melleus]|uniref:Multidrug resistance protein n=1 Tax=Aspergillus melleus TaxID=138277 RepID=UPI001E8E74DE|nr:Multidrug resistance protein [Aspergillus melleus]KAH8425503.1 Multidrug resistance protein [Aspergillus melleus]